MIDTNSIKEVTIRDGEVLLDTQENFYRLRYLTEDEIVELRHFQRFKTLSRSELMEALNLLMITCDFFLNTKTQCQYCPLHKKDGCVFNTIPINWREQENNMKEKDMFCPIMMIGFNPPKEPNEKDMRTCQKNCKWYNRLDDNCAINLIMEDLLSIRIEKDYPKDPHYYDSYE